MRKLGPETSRSHYARIYSQFYDLYMNGQGLDIGYKGEIPDAQPVTANAIGIEKDTPNYDGKTLPYPDNSLDFVFSSHCLEHISEPIPTVQEWFRVIKPYGYLITIVPHQYLYEKSTGLPSKWNADHKRFYTPSKLLQNIELALQPNSYRVKHLRDNDTFYNYEIGPETHCAGACEIELVIQKIIQPDWEIK